MASDMRNLTPAQLKLIQDGISLLRERLAKDAQAGAEAAGFADTGTRNLAALMACIGAAQLMALTDTRLYAIFRMLCLSMASVSSADAVAAKIDEMGPEMFGGDMMPGRRR